MCFYLSLVCVPLCGRLLLSAFAALLVAFLLEGVEYKVGKILFHSVARSNRVFRHAVRWCRGLAKALVRVQERGDARIVLNALLGFVVDKLRLFLARFRRWR